MKILVLASNYPSSVHPLAAIFNERSVAALKGLCDGVEVLAPRPYTPPLLSSLRSHWKIYARIPPYELRNGVPVHRPIYFQIPRLSGGFCIDGSAFLWCRWMARKMHKRTRFDGILSFDLLGAGGIAWKVGRDLGIPASGWATGGDVRVSASSSQGQAVIRAINHLDLVFYQSHELLNVVTHSLGVSQSQMSPDRHMILSRGIPAPPFLPRSDIRGRVRKEWGISDNQVLVINIGRVHREKGIFELIKAVSVATARDPRIHCVVVGSDPAFDETLTVRKKLAELPGSGQRLRLLPACSPDQVWEYLCAADIFAFTSHQEGMPNSLLEAMAMGVPTIAFAIPPVLEVEAGTGAVFLVPPFDAVLFSEGLLHLAASPPDRIRIGETGRDQVMARFMSRKNMASAVERLAGAVHKRSPSQTTYLPLSRTSVLQVPLLKETDE